MKKLIISLIVFIGCSSLYTFAQQKPLPKGFPSECPTNLPKLTNEVNLSPQRMRSDSLIETRKKYLPLTKESVGEIIEILESAIAADTTNDRAYYTLSDIYGSAPRFAGMQKKMGSEKSLEYFFKAFSLNPHSVTGLRGIAEGKIALQNDYTCAREILERILKVDTKNAWIRFEYAILLAAQNNFTEAYKVREKALADADSVTRRSILYNSTRMRFMAHDYDWVINYSDSLIARNPGGAVLHFYKGLALAELGKFDKALEESKLATPSLQGDAGGVGHLARAYVQAGDIENGKKALQELLDRFGRGEHVVKYQIAGVYEALGDFDNTFMWLNRVVEDGDGIHGWLLWLNHDPRWQRIRSDKRFKELTNKAGL
ncbi:tetratricopeptide repeat protein [Runella salmonicolor]|uniref:Tetratricopeptide repeat protein n=1 Tax=Runella salmonicolor TaxID=2950278 RepID=A0ABT1FIW2_9BACT|nr:tetratricopeptide repeat protein [Runella salmonicolor]MCP1381642.1 tetratricopeptide repeat protein [Runella salmonicolor]